MGRIKNPRGRAVIKTFSYPLGIEEIIEKFDDIAQKEGKTFSELLCEKIEIHVKEHGDGNPQFTIEQFEDPNFVACPAFYRDKTAWKNYLSKAAPEELTKFKDQLILIDKTLGRFL